MEHRYSRERLSVIIFIDVILLAIKNAYKDYTGTRENAYNILWVKYTKFQIIFTSLQPYKICTYIR